MIGCSVSASGSMRCPRPSDPDLFIDQFSIRDLRPFNARIREVQMIVATNSKSEDDEHNIWASHKLDVVVSQVIEDVFECSSV
jgi:hypothetical protein